MYLWTRKSPLNFGSHRDPGLDPERSRLGACALRVLSLAGSRTARARISHDSNKNNRSFLNVQFVQMNKEQDEAMSVVRRRRAVIAPSGGSHGYGLVQLPHDARSVVERYLDWRRSNGYGRLNRRWGK